MENGPVPPNSSRKEVDDIQTDHSTHPKPILKKAPPEKKKKYEMWLYYHNMWTEQGFSGMSRTWQSMNLKRVLL
jgi:hypothetical protein